MLTVFIAGYNSGNKEYAVKLRHVKLRRTKMQRQINKDETKITNEIYTA